MAGRLIGLVAAFVATACGGVGPPSAIDDAGPGAGGDGGLLAQAPRIPWLPSAEPPLVRAQLTCAVGWRSVMVGDEVTVCDPWPDTGRATCSDVDMAHFPGEPGCVRVGSACPAGDWAEDLPTDRPIRYVKAGAAVGGDGTRASPFATMRAARAGAPAGTVFALAKGRYDEALSLGTRQALWGACVRETILTSSVASATEGVVGAVGPEAELRNVHIERPARLGVRLVGVGASLRVESVVITEATFAALLAEQSRIDGAGIVIRNTRTLGGEGGIAIDATAGGQVTLGRVYVTGSHTAAVVASGDGTVVSVVDGAVVDTLAASPTDRPDAFFAQDGGTIVAERVVTEGSAGGGIDVASTGGALRLTDVVSRENAGPGVNVVGGGTLEATRVWCDGNALLGVSITGAASATLTDVVVTDTRAPGECTAGTGLQVAEGSSVTATRTAVLRSATVALLLADEATQCSLSDLLVAETQSCTGENGYAIEVVRAARVTIERALLRASETAAVVCVGAGSTFDAVDLAVRDVAERRATGGIGWGVYVGDGAAASLTRTLVERTREVGLFARDPSTRLTLTDVVVRDIASAERDGRHGRGVLVQESAGADAERIRVERTRELGIGVTSGASFAMTDAVVSGVTPAACADTSCPTAGGTAIVSTAGSTVRVMRFQLLDAALCGAQVAEAAQLDLVTGEVARASIGACVQVDGYDLGRLMSDVAYRDNGVNLQATTLTLPAELGSLTP